MLRGVSVPVSAHNHGPVGLSRLLHSLFFDRLVATPLTGCFCDNPRSTHLMRSIALVALAVGTTSAWSANLVSHFPFDADYSNSANSALNSTGQSGGVSISSDAAVGGGSAQFNGIDGVVWAGSNAVPGVNGAFYQGSVAFWVKSAPGASPASKNFMGVNNGEFATTGANDRMAFNVQSNAAGGVQIFIRSQNGTEVNNTLQFRHDEGASAPVRFPTDWNSGDWRHLAFTWRVGATGTESRQIYLDGEPVATASVLATLEADAVKSPVTPWEAPGPGFLIGAVNNRIPTGGTILNPFGGWLDDVRVYDDVLTASEVRGLYALRVPEPSSALGMLILAACGAGSRRRA